MARALTCVSWLLALGLAVAAGPAAAADLSGTVRDETGGALPGVSVVARGTGFTRDTVTDGRGEFHLRAVPSGPLQLSYALANFASVRRDLVIPASGSLEAHVVLHLSLSADVTVTGRSTFTNLADVEDPAGNLVGIALSASQGAITAKQLDTRALSRAGEVLETVPGVVISQHSGEGKANQYYLRGFNLDHGTDFAATVAGMPVNMPSHAHGHGYADLNFLIPELVSGVQFSKGPYFAEQGDFATAGAATINYVTDLGRPIVRVGTGDQGYARVLAAASPATGAGRLLGAMEIEHDDGPWVSPDAYRKYNGVLRYTRGDRLSGFSLTAMGYHGRWNSTDQIPQRGVSIGGLERFGSLDSTDGGDTSRISASFDWQRTRRNSMTKLTAYEVAYDLNLFSNFTYFLDDPINGDQFQQVDHRLVSGVKISHQRLARWGDRGVQNTVGLQLRHDDIGRIGLYHTRKRTRLETVREDAVVQTSAGMYAQNEIAWTPRLRTLAGVRVDGYRFRVDAGDPPNAGVARSGLVSPKGGIVVGLSRGTEVYGNAGSGFHSNDARGATITRDPVTHEAVERVTPLVRATGAEVGIRTVAVPHLQSSLAVWTLRLGSELVFVGDAGTTTAGRPSRRDGLEWTNYYSPRPWLTLDGDVAWSRARFSDSDPVGDRIPGSVEAVISAGASMTGVKNIFASARLRYFGPRTLVEDNTVRSNGTRLLNLEGGYQLNRRAKIVLDVFNALDARDSDIDYYYRSRLPGEPESGVDDVHFHPTLPRTARLSLILGL